MNTSCPLPGQSRQLDRAASICVHSTSLVFAYNYHMSRQCWFGPITGINLRALLAAAVQQVCTAEDACAPCGAALAGPLVAVTFSYDYFEAAVLYSEYEVMPLLFMHTSACTALFQCRVKLLYSPSEPDRKFGWPAEVSASAHRRLLSEPAHSRRWRRCCAYRTRCGLELARQGELVARLR